MGSLVLLGSEEWYSLYELKNTKDLIQLKKTFSFRDPFENQNDLL